MKTKKLLLALPMVAILVACNKGTGNNDIFTQVRKKKVSNEAKQQAISEYKYFEMTTEIVHQDITLENNGGGWLATDVVTTTDYYFTAGSLDSDTTFLTYKKVIGEGSYQSVFIIAGDENNNPEFVAEPASDYIVNDAKKVYKTQYESIFSWNTTFFAGCSYFLLNTQRSFYMPQKVLNKFVKDFRINVDESMAGTFSIVTNPSHPQVTVNGYQYSIGEMHLNYVNYRLDSTQFTFDIVKKQSKTLAKEDYYSVTTSTVNYYDEIPNI